MSADSLLAQTVISSDTTYDGTTLTIPDSGTSANILTINHLGGVTLTLVNGGTVDGAEAVIIGSDGSGSLVIANGGTLTNTGASLSLGIVGGQSIFRGEGHIGLSSSATGTATISGLGSQWTLTNNLYVGSSGEGTLNISDSGRVQSNNGYLGLLSGTGTATISGVGSQWTVSNGLVVSYQGRGTLNISDGGRVQSDDGYLGHLSSGTGTATISGFSSQWTMTGNLIVGNAGKGTLNITDSGRVQSNSGFLGYNAAATGTATISGLGSQWTVTDSLYVGGSASTAGGVGSVTVTDGGSLVVGQTLKLWSNDTLTIGTGAHVTARNFDRASGIVAHLDGTLTVSGGLYTHAGGSGAVANILILNGATSTSVPIFELTNGASTVGIEAVIVGTTGQAQLLISGGSQLSYSGSNISLSTIGGQSVSRSSGYIGFSAGSTGTATITGLGSQWTMTGNLIVGNAGKGTLNVSDSGRVQSNYGYLGFSSTGTATITGLGSQWSITNELYVGHSDMGTLNISDSGRLQSYSGIVGLFSSGTATITGLGSQWSLTDSLYVGYDGTGTLNISDGGQVQSHRGFIGNNSGTGTATISGIGSQWTVTDSLYVGGSASTAGGVGSVTVTDGGSLVVGQTLKLWNNDTLTIGTGAHVTARNFDRASGIVAHLDGTLTVSGGVYTHASGTGLAENILAINGGTPTSVPIFELTKGASTVGVEAVVVGTTGQSQLLVSGGSQLSYSGSNISLSTIGGQSVFRSSGYVGLSAGSTGTATISGLGSQWSLTNDLRVGVSGTGTLNISDSGRVQSLNGYLADQSSGTGTATISGLGSQWSLTNVLYVGRFGTGTLNISDSGRVQSNDGYLGNNSSGTGTATITGLGSQWTVTNSLYVGGSNSAAGGVGRMTVTDGGSLVVSQTLQLWNNGTLDIGPGSTVQVDGQVSVVGGTLTVNGALVGQATVAGTLQGSGQIGAVTVQNGGTLAPGNSVGELDITGNGAPGGDAVLKLEAGATIIFEFRDAGGDPGTGWDYLDLAAGGELNLTGLGGGNRVNLEIVSWLSDNSGPGAADRFDVDRPLNLSWLFIQADLLTGVSPEDLNSDFAAYFDIDDEGVFGGDDPFHRPLNGFGTPAEFGLEWRDDGLSPAGLYLTFTAIPEPSSLVLAGLGSLAAGWYGRRRKKARVAAPSPTTDDGMSPDSAPAALAN